MWSEFSPHQRSQVLSLMFHCDVQWVVNGVTGELLNVFIYCLIHFYFCVVCNVSLLDWLLEVWESERIFLLLWVMSNQEMSILFYILLDFIWCWTVFFYIFFVVFPLVFFTPFPFIHVGISTRMRKNKNKIKLNAGVNVK